MTTAELERQWSELWLPPERLPLSEWAEKNFVLSPEYAAQSAELELYGWQREIFDSFTDPRVSRIVVMCGTQLVKTLFLQCAVAYAIVCAPGPILLAQPKDEDAATFSKERLSPMFRDIPALRGLVAESKSRDSNNTIAHKMFPGGSLTLVGANTPGNFARRTIRYLLLDEVDKYLPTKEGDQIELGAERTVPFGTLAKTIIACSPTTEKGKIWAEWKNSDQREPWVKCPHCQEPQILRFRERVKWDAGHPETARYVCSACELPWTDIQRWAAADKPEWRAKQPFTGTAGFWVSHLYSRNKTAAQIARSFEKSKRDRDKLQVFINTNLAELWREEGEKPNWEVLKGIAEDYEIGDECVVPMRATFLTAAVDFQKDWIFTELKAWGRGKENWSLGMWRTELFDGRGNQLRSTDPAYREWVKAFIQREWPHESGITMPILAMAGDTGEESAPVIDLAKQLPRLAVGPAGARVHTARTFVPVKGASSAEQAFKLIVGVSPESAARKRGGIRIVSIGGAYAKSELYGALASRVNADGTYPAGYCHYSRKYSDDVFRGVCSEERKADGSYEKSFDRNEPLDVHVYNRAMAELVGVSEFTERHWLALERQLGITRSEPVSAPTAQVAAPIPAAPVAQPQRDPFYRGNNRGGSWLPRRNWFDRG